MSARPPGGRLVALFAVLAMGLVGVGVRLVTLQLNQGTRYRALAEEQRVRRIRLVPERGSMLDRSMHELALSLPARAVYADPRAIIDPEGTARQLAPLLGVHEPQLVNLLHTDESFVYLARRLDLAPAQRIEKLELPGIGLLDESKRYYPGRSLAAQVLGFVGVDDAGLSGLELQYQDVLAGRPGSLVVEQDPSGQAIPQGLSEAVEPVRGHDLVLTLDRDLQFQTERALEDAVEQNGAKGGMVIAMVPQTGDILAMAGYPSFDANEFSEALPETTRNRSVTDAYEPGSVNKVITAAAALEEGVVGLHERWMVPDQLQVADKLFHDSHPHPPLRMTLTDVIAQSSNIGTIMTAQRVGLETLDDYLRRFGFGVDTGIDFPGESNGILMPADDWWETSMGTIPIGQGIAVTPLQMLSVYATVANGGVRVEPRLVRGAVSPTGEFLGTQPSPVTRVISPSTARVLTGMLGRAVDSGTGQEAQIPGYWVAGKTGTARKPLEGQLGYSEQYVASFIGFAPARRPAVVVAAILDEPDTVYGGVAAAPLFREVAHFALAHLRVPSADPPRSPPALVGE
jgi:cell division protein FtsI (penicillin-binding protein 3)